MWIDRSYAACCAANALASSRSDSSVDTHRNACANADRDTDPNALTFRFPVGYRERVAQPERVAVRTELRFA